MKKIIAVVFFSVGIFILWAIAGMPSKVDFVVSDGTNLWVVVGNSTNLIFSSTNMARACCAVTNKGPLTQFCCVSNAVPATGDMLRYDGTRWVNTSCFVDMGDPAGYTYTAKKASGTITGQNDNHLIDAGGDFVNDGVIVGDWVWNVTGDTWAQVTAAAAGDLTLDGNIFPDDDGDSYVVGDFKIDTSWHDLDLSSHVPAGAKGVIFNVQMKNSLALISIQFRENGNSNTKNRVLVPTVLANTTAYYPGQIVALDANRKIEYLIANTGVWATMRVQIRGWVF